MRTHLSWIAALLTILSVACGGNASSPLAPSAVAPVVSSAGNAVVTGNVRLGATAGVGSAADPMKVQVVGTDIVATVSLTGQFALNGVPSGQIQLHFFGAGVDATISIGLVTTGETITISVTVVGTSAVVESETRKAADEPEEQIEGRIESLPPTQAPDTFVVAGRTVTTTATTVFKMGSATKTFADLEIGQRVHVKGATAAGVFTASLVEIQNVQADLPVNVNGIVSGLTGSELAFQFMVKGRMVTGDHQTVFFGNGGLNTFTDLADGVRVEVKGQQQDAAIYAVRIHINLGDDDDDDANEFEATGTVSAPNGTCPTLMFTLAGKTVFTDPTTQFKGAGCAGVIDGVKAEVNGVVQADGSVKARKVDVDKDEVEFEAKGAISGLTGTCPAIAFMLAGTRVTTNVSTQFKGGACSDIAEGDEAEVKGLKQAGGTVMATRVETEKAKGKDGDDDDDDDDDDHGGTGSFEGEGPISGLNGSCPAISFSLKGVGIDANAATVFDGVTCAALKNGTKVEVKGTKQTSGRVLATKIEK